MTEQEVRATLERLLAALPLLVGAGLAVAACSSEAVTDYGAPGPGTSASSGSGGAAGQGGDGAGGAGGAGGTAGAGGAGTAGADGGMAPHYMAPEPQD